MSFQLKQLTIPLCDLRLQKSVSNLKLNNIQFKKTEVHEKNGRKANQVNEESDEDEEEDYEVKEVQVVKKVVKILATDSEEEDNSDKDSDFSIEEEDNTDKDPDFSIEEEDNTDKDSDFSIEKKKIKFTKVQNILIKPKHNGEADTDKDSDVSTKKILSPYEQMIERNREEKMAILQSLKLDEAKANLAEVVNLQKTVKRKYERTKKDTSPPVLRKSRRLANINCDLSEDTLYFNAVKAATEQNRKIMLPEISFKDALESEEFYDSYVRDVSIQESKSEYRLFSYSKSVLNKMTVKESNIAKITPSRITSLTWYPSPEQLIVAAGSKHGTVGVWNVDSNSDSYLFNIHYEGITNLQFNPLNRVQLVSSSYDGILRCGDLVHHTSNEVYNISDETSCTYFDFLSATTYLVAQKNGKVALVDERTRSKMCRQMSHTCHEYPIKTVNTHPVNKNFFVTAENKGSIRLWDLRKLQKIPVADITYHKRCVHSAFFSPITGNSILATSTDDSVSIFDSTNLTSDIKMKQQMKHNNQTGRWLSVFRAMWLPNSEEAFVIGSMQQYPRIIQVFDKNMFIYSVMMHENLTISSTNAFHPMRAALAGGNSSGRVFIFT